MPPPPWTHGPGDRGLGTPADLLPGGPCDHPADDARLVAGGDSHIMFYVVISTCWDPSCGGARLIPLIYGVGSGISDRDSHRAAGHSPRSGHEEPPGATRSCRDSERRRLPTGFPRGVAGPSPHRTGWVGGVVGVEPGRHRGALGTRGGQWAPHWELRFSPQEATGARRGDELGAVNTQAAGRRREGQEGEGPGNPFPVVHTRPAQQ